MSYLSSNDDQCHGSTLARYYSPCNFKDAPRSSKDVSNFCIIRDKQIFKKMYSSSKNYFELASKCYFENMKDYLLKFDDFPYYSDGEIKQTDILISFDNCEHTFGLPSCVNLGEKGSNVRNAYLKYIDTYKSNNKDEVSYLKKFRDCSDYVKTDYSTVNDKLMDSLRYSNVGEEEVLLVIGNMAREYDHAFNNCDPEDINYQKDLLYFVKSCQNRLNTYYSDFLCDDEFRNKHNESFYKNDIYSECNSIVLNYLAQDPNNLSILNLNSDSSTENFKNIIRMSSSTFYIDTNSEEFTKFINSKSNLCMIKKNVVDIMTKSYISSLSYENKKNFASGMIRKNRNGKEIINLDAFKKSAYSRSDIDLSNVDLLDNPDEFVGEISNDDSKEVINTNIDKFLALIKEIDNREKDEDTRELLDEVMSDKFNEMLNSKKYYRELVERGINRESIRQMVYSEINLGIKDNVDLSDTINHPIIASLYNNNNKEFSKMQNLCFSMNNYAAVNNILYNTEKKLRSTIFRDDVCKLSFDKLINKYNIIDITHELFQDSSVRDAMQDDFLNGAITINFTKLKDKCLAVSQLGNISRCTPIVRRARDTVILDTSKEDEIIQLEDDFKTRKVKGNIYLSPTRNTNNVYALEVPLTNKISNFLYITPHVKNDQQREETLSKLPNFKNKFGFSKNELFDYRTVNSVDKQVGLNTRRCFGLAHVLTNISLSDGKIKIDQERTYDRDRPDGYMPYFKKNGNPGSIIYSSDRFYVSKPTIITSPVSAMGNEFLERRERLNKNKSIKQMMNGSDNSCNYGGRSR